MNRHGTKTLFQLCYPLFLNGFLSLAVTLADQMIISSYSDAAAAAISIANQVLGVAYDLSGLLAVGGVILVARSLGAGDEARARQIANVAIVANAALSLLIALVLVPAGPLVLSMINTPPEIVGDARVYIHVIAAAMVFNGFLSAAVAVLRAFGHVKAILLLGVFANVLYIGLEYALIHGWGPVPSLGVFGSALATLAVRVTGVLLLVWILARRLQLQRRSGLAARAWAALVRRLFMLSYPSVLDNMAYAFCQLIFVGFIAGLGVSAVLGRSYTLSLTAFLSLIVMTISQGNEVMVGWRVGAGDAAAARARALRSAAIAAVLATALAVVLYLFARPLIGLFTANEEVHASARQLLLLSIFLQPVTALNMVLFNSLKAAGDVLAPVVASQLVMWLVALPLAWVLTRHHGMGVAALWIVFIVEETLKSAYMLHRWLRGRWQPMGLAAAAA
ncbi:MATE family efflux transporter [Aquincola sp. MAHUQ-54]|uniref:MATE family efflux transporter n=1 Tax=Aquincola agrisoli TaxID=3119538 RepID=A0AAW9QQZ5_9BURK